MRLALAHVLRRLQALHVGRLPGGVPDRRAVPHRVRHRRRAARRLQRLRLLRPRLPVRRHRPARGGRPRLQVHALLRPPQGRTGAGVREGVPDRLDPVRRRSTSCASAPPSARGGAAGRRRVERAALRRGPGRRRRRPGRVLPAARRARGLRPAARPGLDHARPAARLWRARRLAAGAAAWPARRQRWSGGAGRAIERSATPTTGGRSSRRRCGRWEIPVYFFVGGMAGAAAPLALGAELRGRPRAGAARLAASRSPASAVSPAAADLRPRAPRALPQHAARVQADLADERRLVDPRRRSAPRSRSRSARELLRRFPRRAARRPARPRRRSARRSRPTRRRWSPTRPSRCGTRRGASCRSCSPPARRCQRGGGADAAHAGGGGAGAAPGARRRGGRARPATTVMERRLGAARRALPRGRRRPLRAGREGADRRAARW